MYNVNHKSRKVAVQPTTGSRARIISDRKLSTFEQARLNARTGRFTMDEKVITQDIMLTEDEKYQEHVATCEQSFDIMEQMLAIYTQYPDARYFI